MLFDIYTWMIFLLWRLSEDNFLLSWSLLYPHDPFSHLLVRIKRLLPTLRSCLLVGLSTSPHLGFGEIQVWPIWVSHPPLPLRLDKGWQFGPSQWDSILEFSLGREISFGWIYWKNRLWACKCRWPSCHYMGESYLKWSHTKGYGDQKKRDRERPSSDSFVWANELVSVIYKRKSLD